MPSDYTLVRLCNGAFSLHSQAYGETMHPGVGPAAEAEALYVQQTRLRERLRNHRGEFVIWDVGLGAGANVLTVLSSTQDIPTHLRLLSFDNTDAPLQFALEQGDALPFVFHHRDVVRRLLNERRIQFSDGRRQVEWELWLDDFPALLTSGQSANWPRPHLILFDPFSPAANPAMWTLALFQNLFRMLDPQRECLLATYSRSTMLRVTLLLAGFFVGCGAPTGRKEETTLAANAFGLLERPLDERWLRRAQRSDSAQPLSEAIYRRASLEPKLWEQLRKHVQFGPA